MYRPVLVTPPVIKPITLVEAKAVLDISYSEKDTLIGGLIAAATSYLDGWTGILGRALCEQTWRQDFDGLSYGASTFVVQGNRVCRGLRMPLFPVISITSVTYKDTAGATQTIDPANYSLQTDDLGSYVQFISTYASPSLYTEVPRAGVTYKAGYADNAAVSTVPDAIRQAMLLLVRHWFDNPSAVIIGASAVQALPFAVEALLSPYRRVRF